MLSGEAASRIALLAHDALMLEVTTFPKPGLVSRVDSGSHDDMTIETFRASAAAIRPSLALLAQAGASLSEMAVLRRIGLDAEAAMLAVTGGVNTHRGAIFGLGLLCAAAGARQAGLGRGSLGGIVAGVWGRSILGEPAQTHSHGGQARLRHGAGGAREQAAAGFPTLYAVGLPMLRDGLLLSGGDGEASRVQCLFGSMAVLEDTTLLHRGGRDGLGFVQDAARGFLAAGGVGDPGWRARALALHRRFVARRLSPGGSADLLAMSLFVDALSREPVQVLLRAERAE